MKNEMPKTKEEWLEAIGKKVKVMAERVDSFDVKLGKEIREGTIKKVSLKKNLINKRLIIYLV